MLTVECPLNSLSFGNVSVNILRELYRLGKEIALFPIGDKVDLAAYKLDPEFTAWMEDSINKRWERYDSSGPALKLWHIRGAENRKCQNQFLYTFHECSEPTEVELSIVRNQTFTFFSSEYSAGLFCGAGITNCNAVPLGFDQDFKVETNPRKPDGIQFGLMGKFEYRKRTEKIIKTWLKEFGNKIGYTLNLCVTNPFFQPDDMKNVLAACFEGEHYSNVNILPYLETNQDVNAFLNIVDIDLSGLSGGEGWNLPAFNSTCLGKWSVVLNATSHKDWANKLNSILVEPLGKIEAHDGVFFKKGDAFNQGHFFDWDEAEATEAMKDAASRAGRVNSEGINMSREKTYGKTVDRILETIANILDE